MEVPARISTLIFIANIGQCRFLDGRCRNGKRDKDKLGVKKSRQTGSPPSTKRKKVSSSGSMSDRDINEIVTKKVKEQMDENQREKSPKVNYQKKC